MAYTAMYRKFRPDTFSEVKGQEPIVKTLKNQILSDRVGHAYLFCGTRGTGKTTVAKILARAINCEHNTDGNPCNMCAVCRSIMSGSSMNVVEIDAASNNGVENIREIVENVRYSPTEGRYKVYIIDEVHMLSTGAFNALLKTLEEPPAYVVFILATTEAHKIPITIMSRCQRYDFKRISIETISDRLMDLCEREQLKTDREAMDYVAKLADGSMRDALSLLERCAAFFYGEELTYDRILDVLGTVDVEVFAKMLRYIRAGSVTDCIRLLDEMVIEGRELPRFVVDLTWYMRNLLLAKSGDDLSRVLGVTTEQMQILSHEAQVFSTDELLRYINVLSELNNRIRFANERRILIEMAFIELCRPQMDVDNSAVLDRIRRLEEELAKLKKNGIAVAAEPQTSEEPEEPVVLEKAVSEDLQSVLDSWNTIRDAVSLHTVQVVLQSCLLDVSDDRLLIYLDDQTDFGLVNKEDSIYEIKKAIAKNTNKDVDVEVKFAERGAKDRPKMDIREAQKRVQNRVSMPINFSD